MEPEHYTKRGIYDPRSIMKTYLSEEGLYGFYFASAVTHLLRHLDKGSPIGDLEKARTFIDWLLDTYMPEGKVEVVEHKKD